MDAEIAALEAQAGQGAAGQAGDDAGTVDREDQAGIIVALCYFYV